MSYRWDEDFETAAKKLEEFLKLSPDSVFAFYDLGYCYYKLKRYDKAAEAFSRYLDGGLVAMPLYIREAHYYRGQSYFFAGDYRKAIYDFSWSLARGYTESGRVNDFLARAYCRLCNLKRALKEFRRALEADEFEADFYIHMADCYRRFGMLEEALEAVNAAIRIDHDNAGYHYIKAGLLGKLERLDEAVIEYSLVLKFAPQHCCARMMRAQAWALMGRLDEAERDLAKAEAEGGTRSATYYYVRSLIRFESGACESALEDINRAIAMGCDTPSMACFYRQRARIYEAMGDVRAAEQDRLKADCMDAAECACKRRSGGTPESGA